MDWRSLAYGVGSGFSELGRQMFDMEGRKREEEDRLLNLRRQGYFPREREPMRVPTMKESFTAENMNPLPMRATNLATSAALSGVAAPAASDARPQVLARYAAGAPVPYENVVRDEKYSFVPELSENAMLGALEDKRARSREEFSGGLAMSRGKELARYEQMLGRENSAIEQEQKGRQAHAVVQSYYKTNEPYDPSKATQYLGQAEAIEFSEAEKRDRNALSVASIYASGNSPAPKTPQTFGEFFQLKWGELTEPVTSAGAMYDPRGSGGSLEGPETQKETKARIAQDWLEMHPGDPAATQFLQSLQGEVVTMPPELNKGGPNLFSRAGSIAGKGGKAAAGFLFGTKQQSHGLTGAEYDAALQDALRRGMNQDSILKILGPRPSR